MNRAEFESRARMGDRSLGAENLAFRVTVSGKVHTHVGTILTALCGLDSHRVNASLQTANSTTFADIVRRNGFGQLCASCVRVVCSDEIYQ